MGKNSDHCVVAFHDSDWIICIRSDDVTDPEQAGGTIHVAKAAGSNLNSRDKRIAEKVVRKTIWMPVGTSTKHKALSKPQDAKIFLAKQDRANKSDPVVYTAVLADDGLCLVKFKRFMANASKSTFKVTPLSSEDRFSGAKAIATNGHALAVLIVDDEEISLAETQQNDEYEDEKKPAASPRPVNVKLFPKLFSSPTEDGRSEYLHERAPDEVTQHKNNTSSPSNDVEDHKQRFVST
ncbi:MAG: hypothetical protein SGARI_001582, partial [Bacillariaceae sp.]